MALEGKLHEQLDELSRGRVGVADRCHLVVNAADPVAVLLVRFVTLLDHSPDQGRPDTLS